MSEMRVSVNIESSA